MTRILSYVVIRRGRGLPIPFHADAVVERVDSSRPVAIRISGELAVEVQLSPAEARLLAEELLRVAGTEVSGG